MHKHIIVLVSLEDYYGVPLLAAEGPAGDVEDFLFDDEAWLVRHLVVDVGGWVGRRDVAIPISALEKPVWATKTFVTTLTRDAVRRSPGAEQHRPVSRQQEIAMNQYYGWPAYWRGMSANAELPPVSVAAGREFPVRAGEDPHLRSAQAVIGYKVWGGDNFIGTLENLIVDERSWHIGYLDVKTGKWLDKRAVLLPTRLVTAISWAKHRIRVVDSESKIASLR